MNNKNNISISKRYAKSLVDIMRDNRYGANEIKDNLHNVQTILNDSKELFSVMTNPIVSAVDKTEIIDCVFEKDTNETVRNFLKFLIEKNRFNLINSIISEFVSLADKINNIVKVSVKSAVELNDEQKSLIQNRLNDQLKKETEMNYETDSSIIAGLVFKIEDDVLDTSVLHHLEEIKKDLIKN